MPILLPRSANFFVGGIMNKKQIQKIADFMYSSNTSKEVPFRLVLSYGMCGDDLNKEQFIQLLSFLNHTDCTKESFVNFMNLIGIE